MLRATGHLSICLNVCFIFILPVSVTAQDNQIRQVATLSGHINAVGGIEFTADGKTIVSSSRDGTIRFWDVGTGQETEKYLVQGDEEVPENPGAFAIERAPYFSLVGAGKVAFVADGTVKFLTQGKGIASSRKPNESSIRHLDVFRDGKRMAVYESYPLKRKIAIVDIATNRQIGAMPREDTLLEIVVSPDGKRIAELGDQLIIWDVESKAMVGEPIEFGATARHSLDFSPDSALWAVIDGTKLKVFDSQNAKLRFEMSLIAPLSPPNFFSSIAWSPDGKSIAVVGSRGVELIDVTSKKSYAQLKDKTPLLIGAIAYSPNGEQLAFALDKTNDIQVWDVSAHAGEVILPARVAEATPAPSVRTWTSANGQFTLKAKLVSTADGKVVLEREDGQQITIPLSSLSAEDNAFVSSTQN